MRNRDGALVVRLDWDVSAGHHHPRHSFVRVNDMNRALDAILRARECAPRGITCVAAYTSLDGGDDSLWAPVSPQALSERAARLSEGRAG